MVRMCAHDTTAEANRNTAPRPADREPDLVSAGQWGTGDELELPEREAGHLREAMPPLAFDDCCAARVELDRGPKGALNGALSRLESVAQDEQTPGLRQGHCASPLALLANPVELVNLLDRVFRIREWLHVDVLPPASHGERNTGAAH